MGGHLLAPYLAMGYRREVVAYFISKVFQNLYSKISLQPHAFFLRNMNLRNLLLNLNLYYYEKTFTFIGGGRNDFHRLYAGWRTR